MTRDILLLLLGGGVGACIGALWVGHQCGVWVDGLNAEHDETVERLVKRMKAMEAEHADLIDSLHPPG